MRGGFPPAKVAGLMAQTASAYTVSHDSKEAGADLGNQLRAALEGQKPDAVIVFVSSQFDYEALLAALVQASGCRLLIGSSSAGEFTSRQRGEGTACALAIRDESMQFRATVGRGVGGDRKRAAGELLEGFSGLDDHTYPYRAAVIMTDALAGHADDLVDQLTVMTAGRYQFVGGGAGDDAKFSRTHVFLGEQAYTDAAVALEILATKPFGLGVRHGWVPGSKAMRVTKADGMRLISINGFAAVHAFEEHAAATGQRFDRDDPLPFFLHNVVGIHVEGDYRLRVPLGIDVDGSLTCAAEVPTGSTISIMVTTSSSAAEAAAAATAAAVRALGNVKPAAALFFDCVATRLRLGDAFGFELEAVNHALGGAELVGCNTYGQIARGEGQFGGFHNCTAVVFVLPA